MKRIHTLPMLAAAVVLAAAPVFAQADDAGPSGGRGPAAWGRPGEFGGQFMPDRAMRRDHMRGMHGGMHHQLMMRDPVARLLDHQTFLRLTPAQVNNLISIDDKLHNDNKPLVARLMAMHPRFHEGNNRRGEGRDSTTAGARAAQRDSVMGIVRTVRENVWRATSAADAVLTPEQLNSAATLDAPGHRGRPGRMGPGTTPGGRGMPGDRG